MNHRFLTIIVSFEHAYWGLPLSQGMEIIHIESNSSFSWPGPLAQPYYSEFIHFTNNDWSSGPQVMSNKMRSLIPCASFCCVWCTYLLPCAYISHGVAVRTRITLLCQSVFDLPVMSQVSSPCFLLSFPSLFKKVTTFITMTTLSIPVVK